ncbi:MAG TPA: TetR/AcrR family transcriptional regulator [Phnomibacter sp.]|nr:TetR/AcrR family transcriptional regulator [Phnomibacter sp.]
MELNEMVMQKSYELFKRYGIRSVTMDEIAVQCGMSKKTVYQAFADKDSLVGAIMEHQIRLSESNCTRSQKESENAIHEIFLSLDWVHRMFDGVNPALLFDLRKYHSNVFQRMEEHKKTFLTEIFRKNFERGIAEGLYRPEINIDILLPFRIHTMTLVFEYDLFPTNKYTLYDIDKELTLHELYGIATSRGVKMIEKYLKQRSK